MRQTHSVRWQKKYPWLGARRRGFGCADCAANGSEASQWSTFSVLSAEALRPSGFKNHEDSAEHQGLHRATSPTKQEFLDALRAVRKGVAVLPNAGRHKVRRMKFCLGEGIRQRNVQAIVESETLGLFQDVRASSLQGTRGCLGQCKVEDGSALGLRNSTLFIMMRACTPYIPPHLPEGFTIPDGYGELAKLLSNTCVSTAAASTATWPAMRFSLASYCKDLVMMVSVALNTLCSQI